MSIEILKIVVIVLYAGIILYVGIIGKRKTKSTEDLLFGGGKIGALMSAFSYGTAYFSAVLFIGFAGQIGWNYGLSGLWIALINALVGVFGAWMIIGWRMKSASLQYNAQTLGEFLEGRYQNSHLRIISTFAIFIFLIPYSAAVFMGLSYLFQFNFNIPYEIAVIVMGVFTTFYLVMGGYKSVAIIDVIFGSIMLVGVSVLLYSTSSTAGGFEEILSKLNAIDPKLTATVGPPGLWSLFSLIFLTSIAPFAMPQLLQKFVSIKDRKSIKKGAIASTIFALIIGGVAYFVGATTRILITPEEFPEAFNLDSGTPIYDRLMPELLGHVVPDFLSILLLLLILAASMSSLASMVLTSSSTFVKDIYLKLQKEEIEDRKVKKISRLASVIFVILAVVLALGNFDSIVMIMSLSWGALGSVFLGPVIWGLYGKPSTFTKFEALFASIFGLGTCFLLAIVGRPTPEAGTIGMLVSFCTPILLAGIRKIQQKQQ
ncbi:sodium:solute symporter [Candidatus Lokiarchaeum ossiferum]|uniref:sodium:solute symporter n=1 Tax=Candidatus Lokiarchaeum ossiferum TaxID=2951803 RepID=UPI00352EBD29